MLVAVLLIISGLILLLGAYANGGRGGRYQRPWDLVAVAIGVIDIIVGLLNVLSVAGIILIFVGLALAANALDRFPGIGKQLGAAGNTLRGFALILGLIALVAGIVAIL